MNSKPLVFLVFCIVLFNFASSCKEENKNTKTVFAQSTQPIYRPYMVAKRTEKIEKGLRVYEVSLISSENSTTIEMISGRIEKQFTNQEDIADIGSPLPTGTYNIEPIVNAPKEKFGGFFIPITPLFNTERYALGIHHDQEFQIGGKELGTEGCLATMTEEDKQTLLDFFNTHNPTTIIVQ